MFVKTPLSSHMYIELLTGNVIKYFIISTYTGIDIYIQPTVVGLGADQQAITTYHTHTQTHMYTAV